MARTQRRRLKPYRDPVTGLYDARAHNPKWGEPGAQQYVLLGTTFVKEGPCRTRGASDCCVAHAQDAFYAEQERPSRPETFRAYFETWSETMRQSERTDRTDDGRVRGVLKVEIRGKKLGDYIYRDITRDHVKVLVTHLVKGGQHNAGGIRAILRGLTTMTEAAIDSGVAEANPFKRQSFDSGRVVKPTSEPKVFQMEELHEFARAAGAWEAPIRVLSDCGPRLGEFLALRTALQNFKGDKDGKRWLRIKDTAWEGKLIASSREKQHDRLVPLPHSTAALLADWPIRIDSEWLFPTFGRIRESRPRTLELQRQVRQLRDEEGLAWAEICARLEIPEGRAFYYYKLQPRRSVSGGGLLWNHNNFYRDVWNPARERSGINATPQDFRASSESHFRALGLDEADLAMYYGHTLQTADAHYVRALNRSADAFREAV